MVGLGLLERLDRMGKMARLVTTVRRVRKDRRVRLVRLDRKGLKGFKASPVSLVRTDRKVLKARWAFLALPAQPAQQDHKAFRDRLVFQDLKVMTVRKGQLDQRDLPERRGRLVRREFKASWAFQDSMGVMVRMDCADRLERRESPAPTV